jgi:hypothetical protein
MHIWQTAEVENLQIFLEISTTPKYIKFVANLDSPIVAPPLQRHQSSPIWRFSQVGNALDGHVQGSEYGTTPEEISASSCSAESPYATTSLTDTVSVRVKTEFESPSTGETITPALLSALDIPISNRQSYMSASQGPSLAPDSTLQGDNLGLLSTPHMI